MKLNSVLSESRLDHFPDVEKLSFDPDRASAFDVQHALMPLLVKMAYVRVMDAKAKHEKDNWDPEDEDHSEFNLSTDTLAEKVEDVINDLVGRLEGIRSDDIIQAIKLEKKSFKTPLTESAGSKLGQLQQDIEGLFKRELKDLSDDAGSESSHSIGGNYRAVVSGDVSIEKNFTSHDYGSATRWNAAIKIGNNRKNGSALDEANALMKDITDHIKDNNPNKVESRDKDNLLAYFDDGTICVKCQYARSFCWVAYRITLNK